MWLPSLRHKWPCETYALMNVRGKSLRGGSLTFKSTFSFSDPPGITANLRTKILDFRGLDSGRILIFRGGTLMSAGNSPEFVSQATLVGIISLGKIGRALIIGGGMIRLEFLGDLPFLTNTVLRVVIAFGYIMQAQINCGPGAVRIVGPRGARGSVPAARRKDSSTTTIYIYIYIY